jgi:hypothetical protein
VSTQDHTKLSERIADKIDEVLHRPEETPATAPSPAAQPPNRNLGAQPGASPTLGGDPVTPAAAATDTASGSYAAQIYDQLVELFGSTSASERFVMEFPGRVLDPTVYAYPITGPYSPLAKPQIVAEEEFRLTDGLFDMAATKDLRGIVNGPNGDQLSTSYVEALNLLVPQVTDAEVRYAVDKETLRGWLSALVGTGQVSADGTPERASRIELYEQKSAAYNERLLAWRKDKETWYQQAVSAADPEAALDVYARQVSENAQMREGEIAALWDDLVARGYYHEVREALGFLDVATPAEILDQAKAAMRQSGLSSLDETETIYPVQLQPSDWFNDLVSDFSPVDLLLDPASIQATLAAKQTELEGLQQQIGGLLAQQTGDKNALQSQVDAARTAVDDATTKLTTAFTQNTITAVKMYLAAKSGSGTDPGAKLPDDKAFLADLNKTQKPNQPPITDQQWNEITTGLANVASAQQQLTETSGRLAQLLSAEAAATVTDARTAAAALQTRIAALTSQINALNAMLDSAQGQQVLAASGAAATAAAAAGGTSTGLFDPKGTPYATGLLPAKPDAAHSTAIAAPSSSLLPSQIQGNWETVVIRASSSENQTMSDLHSDSSTTSFSVNLFFGSVSGTSTSDHATDASSASAANADIAIGMLVSKVEIDRGGWFQPDIFAHGDSFARLSKDTPAQGLPGYPTGFIVAKDVTIVLSLSGSDSTKSDAVADAAQSTSGGFLCFSVASSSASHDEHHQTAAAAYDNSVVVRIPQPQIIGWFLETVAGVASPEYDKLPPGYPPPSAAVPPEPALAATV